jgi:catechol 2,3-dioxygenase
MISSNVNEDAADSPDEGLFEIHPAMKIGHVSLNVSNLEKSLEFYKSVLGLKTVGRVSDGRVHLSTSENESSSSYLVELVEVKTGGYLASGKDLNRYPTIPRRAGLYHFALLLPERRFLADMLQNLSEKREQVHFDGFADHLVSESLYIRDPDFNGIEIYRDRPKSEWRWRGSQIEMATLPLNTNDLLKEATEKGWRGMPVKTTIGHIHLHVSDLAKARQFYQERLGLQLTARIPSALFFAADGYHHHLATNTWLGTGIPQALPESVAGLNHFSIKLPNKQEFQKLLEQFLYQDMVMIKNGSSDRSVLVHDADAIRIQVEY